MSLWYKIKSFIVNGSINTSFVDEERVNVITLDEFSNTHKILNVDLLKIDTEGHEHEVLKGIQGNIKKIRYILIEFRSDKIYLSYNPKKIHNYLIKNDFVLENTYKFPFTTWEDRFYFNKRFK